MGKHTCVGRKVYYKIEIVPNSIYKFNIIPNKISKVFVFYEEGCWGLDKMILKFILKNQHLRIAQDIFKNNK